MIDPLVPIAQEHDAHGMAGSTVQPVHFVFKTGGKVGNKLKGTLPIMSGG